MRLLVCCDYNYYYNTDKIYYSILISYISKHFYKSSKYLNGIGKSKETSIYVCYINV